MDINRKLWVVKKDENLSFDPLQAKEEKIRQLEAEIGKLREEIELYKMHADDAMRNSITGLYNNRKFMYSQVEQLLSHSKRNNESILVVYIDLVQMKLINDCFGHEFGDEAILSTSISIKSCLRNCDQIYHIGGDEFIVFASFKNDSSENSRIAIEGFSERIRQKVSENPLIISKCLKYPLSVSIGYTFICSNEAIKQAIQRADEEMYRDKKSR